MVRRFLRWLYAVQLIDPLEQQQAGVVQIMLFGLMGVSLLGLSIPFISSLPLMETLLTAGVISVIAILAAAAIALVRRDRFQAAVLLSVIGLVLVFTVLLIGTGLAGGGALLFAFSVPMTLSGLLGSRRVLNWTLVASLGGVFLTLGLTLLSPEMTGFASPPDGNIVGVVTGAIAVAVALAFILNRFGSVLSKALRQAYMRERQLEVLRASLEETVVERTARLERALADLQLHATEQARLLAETAAQQETIRVLSVPVLPVAPGTLVLPLIGSLDEGRIRQLRERALQATEESRARHLVLDVTGVPVIDGAIAAGLVQVVQAVALLGARVLLVGVRPEVAQSIVESGFDLRSVPTFSSLQNALLHLAPAR